jgi:dUTP pyrophosphatase
MQPDVIRMEVQTTDSSAKLPYRKRATDAGYDLFSIEHAIVEPGKSQTIRTGIRLSCPPGYFYTIEGRSSVFMKGVLPNRAIIDATYTGEITVTLFNSSSEAFWVDAGDRIAQAILFKQYDMDFDEVDNFSTEYSNRGVDGFGSSGK